ncbi:MAG: nucleotidyltransferase [Candidatus Hodarchaeales archaeon]
MTSENYRVNLNRDLQTIALKLDIDPTRYKKAETSYKAVGKWLEAEGSPLHQYDPVIYPQGSFLLGTVVKPLNEDYDLDFVCLLQQGYSLHSQETFRMIRDQLEEHGTYSTMLQPPKNRCWRLVYAGDFHMDIIPAIPDSERGDTAILVPDRKLSDWTKSDPKEYAKWFMARIKDQYDLLRAELAKKELKEVEEVPDYFVKTQLQQAIQLMKRHRDIAFQEGRKKDKPISIIITTLAGLVYEDQGEQEDLFHTLKFLSENMSKKIDSSNPKIPNPTNLDEDFADKWKEKPERENAFYEWIIQLQTDLAELDEFVSLAACQEKLKEMFGENVVVDNIKELPEHQLIKVDGRGQFAVAHRKNPATKWKMVISPRNDVTIRGYIQHGESQDEFKSNCPSLNKGLSIYFLARPRNIDRPYEVHWQVVNTGDEAAAVDGGLRGGFYESEASYSHKRKERTLYKGMHWIEAFIVKNSTCVARSGEFIVNIE